MKNLIIISLLLLSIHSCSKNVSEENYDFIIGTWVGVNYPKQDTLFFFNNEKVLIVGNRKSNVKIKYIINKDMIVFNESPYEDMHEYQYINDTLILNDMFPSSGIINNSKLKYIKYD